MADFIDTYAARFRTAATRRARRRRSATGLATVAGAAAMLLVVVGVIRSGPGTEREAPAVAESFKLASADATLVTEPPVVLGPELRPGQDKGGYSPGFEPMVVFSVQTADPWSSEALGSGAAAPSHVAVQWGVTREPSTCLVASAEADASPLLAMLGPCAADSTDRTSYPAGRPDGRTVRMAVGQTELAQAQWWRAVVAYQPESGTQCPVTESSTPGVAPGACVSASAWARLPVVRDAASDFSTNARGQTYGSTDGVASDEYPDLILVQATNGRNGYVERDMLNEITGANVSSPKEALAYMEERDAGGPQIRYIPVYESDGRTEIGRFEIDLSGGGEPTRP